MKRKVSTTARNELVSALARGYAVGTRAKKTRILNEFEAVTGFHRKHAMRVLRSGAAVRRAEGRTGRRIYDEAVRDAGGALGGIGPDLRQAVEGVDADAGRGDGAARPSEARAGDSCRAARHERGDHRQVSAQGPGAGGRPAPPSSIRRSIPVRTFSDWDNPPPGFVEADLVAHSGPVTRGSFVQTLVVTDIATGWTECAPVLYREQTLLREVLGEVRRLMPFELLGFDTDNDTVFINETLRDYCRDAGIVFTRCRPWRKNDQAFVEQKNVAVVRRIVGHRRVEGLEVAAALSRLYATTRLYVNFFQPSFKLASKRRDCAREQTPPRACDTGPAAAGGREDARRRVRVCYRTGRHVGSDPAASANACTPATRRGDRRPAGCRTRGCSGPADGAVPRRPANRVVRRRGESDGQAAGEAETGTQATRPVGRRDGAVARVVRGRAGSTSSQLLEKLQEAHPDEYPDNLLRTLQRRVKVWRRENATAMVFGELPSAESPDEAV